MLPGASIVEMMAFSSIRQIHEPLPRSPRLARQSRTFHRARTGYGAAFTIDSDRDFIDAAMSLSFTDVTSTPRIS
jgi:hypothetical protein